MRILEQEMRLSEKTATVAVVTVALLAIVAIPSIAAPASQTYQAMTAPKQLHAGASTQITATLKQAQPNCPYSTVISVTGPGGVSATDHVTVQTEAGGNGHTAVSFPSAFSGTANTNTVGTYTVSISFQCLYTYTTGVASTTFAVTK